MATNKKQPWNRHRSSAGCRHGLACYKEKEDLAALQVPHPPTQQCPVVMRYAKNRLDSGQLNRQQGESSEFFKGRAHRGWLTSNYDVEYCSKSLSSPTKSLPLSPTRKNNPHPLKGFMMHRIPGRTHRHPNAIPPNPLMWKFVNETFYEDCRDTFNDGDIGTGVPITNVTKIPFPGIIKPSHVTFGDKPPEEDEVVKFLSSKEVNHGPLVQQEVKTQYMPVLKEWFKEANGREREMLVAFLKGGKDRSDQRRLEKAVGDILQPGSAEGLDGWISEMPPNEKKAILDVLEDLKQLSVKDYGRYHREPVRRYGLPQAYQQAYQNPVYPQSAPTGSERTRGMFQWSQGYIVGVRKDGQPLPDKPKSSYVYEKKPQVWYHRINNEGPPVHARAGGLFARPQRNMGQHFGICPEWPIA